MMITLVRFADGPAQHTSLQLARCPLFLRVVRDVEGRWDALDLLDDEPRPGETITVYRLRSSDGTCHIDFTEGGRRKGKWLRMATYALSPAQPDEATVRSTAAWRKWCEAQAQEQEQPGA